MKINYKIISINSDTYSIYMGEVEAPSEVKASDAYAGTHVGDVVLEMGLVGGLFPADFERLEKYFDSLNKVECYAYFIKLFLIYQALNRDASARFTSSQTELLTELGIKEQANTESLGEVLCFALKNLLTFLAPESRFMGMVSVGVPKSILTYQDSRVVVNTEYNRHAFLTESGDVSSKSVGDVLNILKSLAVRGLMTTEFLDSLGGIVLGFKKPEFGVFSCEERAALSKFRDDIKDMQF
jgi:hypothetical protein